MLTASNIEEKPTKAHVAAKVYYLLRSGIERQKFATAFGRDTVTKRGVPRGTGFRPKNRG